MRHRRTRPATDLTPKGRPARDRRRPRLPTALSLALHKKFRTAGPAAVAAVPGRASAAGLVSQVLRDGERVLLVRRPSLWFIVLSSWRWVAVGAAVIAAAAAFGSHGRGCAEAGVAVSAGRLMWAALQWMGRLYVLTDLRLLTVTGISRVEVNDCPLRKVARTRLVRSAVDKLLGIGSVEIVPQDPEQPFAVWQQVARPAEVHEQIVATINRAKGGSVE